MNIQSTNLNLPVVYNNSNRSPKVSKALGVETTDNKHGGDQTNSLASNATARQDALQTLDNLQQNQSISNISKENPTRLHSIQSYLDNLDLANQSERDELQELLGIDTFA